MTQNKYIESVSVLHPVCCGLDVHKDKISACLIYMDSGEAKTKIKEFEAFTDDLLELRYWLLKYDCPVIAMESTGVYWCPVHNILEGYVNIILVNARHYKNVPGRKTDIRDSQWLAELLRHGLLRGSFIPEEEIRKLRYFVSLRKHFVKTESDYRRRVQKVFETANIKISSVVSDLFGVSGRYLIELIVSVPTEDITLEDVEQCLHGRLRVKGEELFKAVKGFFADHHRYCIRRYLNMIDSCQAAIKDIHDKIAEMMKPHEELLARMIKVPGMGAVSSPEVLAYIGIDLQAFPNSAALCSWAGTCPGSNESAGKRYSGRSPVKKHPLKTLLVEVAWAAIKKKDSYFRDKYYRLRSRIGAKRAIIAIANKILKVLYHIIKEGEEYHELGAGYLSEQNRAGEIRRMRELARKHGFKVVEA